MQTIFQSSWQRPIKDHKQEDYGGLNPFQSAHLNTILPVSLCENTKKKLKRRETIYITANSIIEPRHLVNGAYVLIILSFRSLARFFGELNDVC